MLSVLLVPIVPGVGFEGGPRLGGFGTDYGYDDDDIDETKTWLIHLYCVYV